METMNEILRIVISEDFSDSPGGRHREDGDFSGEMFREDILENKYLEAAQNNMTLFIDLDGAFGYTTSFLDEAFGGLARKYGSAEVSRFLVFKYDDEPATVSLIEEYINSASDNTSNN